jgi:hypothetical protein
MSLFENEKPDMFGRNVPPNVMEIMQEGADRLTIQWMKFASILERRKASKNREKALMQNRITSLEAYIEQQKRTKKSERNNGEMARSRKSIETLKQWMDGY